jgi:histidyl-tRNA synthetase
MVMKDQEVEVPALPTPPVYLAYLGKASRAYAVKLLAELREAGIGAQIAMRGSLRSQLRHANKRDARYALIIGEDELARDEVTLRDMQSGDQTMVPTSSIIAVLREQLIGQL